MALYRTCLSVAVGLMLVWGGPASAQTGNARPSAADSSEIQLIAVKAKADKPGIYHLTFIAPDSLPNDAVIEMTFPPEFGLEPLEIAGSRDMTGGLRLQKNNQRVVVQRTGLGDPVPPGKPVTLKLGLIRNPAQLDSSYTVSMVLRNPGKPSIILEKQVRVRFQVQ